MKPVFGICLILFLAGCESFGSRITDERLINIDKVGVVSLLDDQVSYNYVGVTIFNNKDTLYPFAGLGIDDYVVTHISSALQRANPKVEVVPVQVDFETFRSAYTNQQSIAGLKVQRFAHLFSEKAAELGLRHIIVASRDYVQFDETPVMVNGFGLRKRIWQDEVGSFVLIKFQLIDLSDWEELATTRIFERHKDSDFKWQEPFDQNGHSEKNRLKTYVYQTIDNWSRRIASALIQSPKDFEVCSQKIYAAGFTVDGVVYTTREEVVKIRQQHIRRKIKTEGVNANEAAPAFEAQFNLKEEAILDCIAQGYQKR